MCSLHHSSRLAIDPHAASGMDTGALRRNFLVEDLFGADQINLTYAHYERMIAGGAMPVKKALALTAIKPTGTASFLERREMAVFNVGGPGSVSVAGKTHSLEFRDMIYAGKEAGEVSFASDKADNPAKFYILSAPAHHAYPVQLVRKDDANRIDLGAQKDANERSIFQYVHAHGIKTCQLVTGLTMLAPGSVWNTMPCHLHERRSEIYLYLDLDAQARVFHLMGTPSETRHIVVKNEQAVLAPNWSIHSGAGTSNYSFIWAMAGDNVDFTDMDPVGMEDLK